MGNGIIKRQLLSQASSLHTQGPPSTSELQRNSEKLQNIGFPKQYLLKTQLLIFAVISFVSVNKQPIFF